MTFPSLNPKSLMRFLSHYIWEYTEILWILILVYHTNEKVNRMKKTKCCTPIEYSRIHFAN